MKSKRPAGAPPDSAALRADTALLLRCQNGDLEAFQELVKRYSPAAVRIARVLLKSNEEAMDCSQDAFVLALEKLAAFDAAKPFFPWFYVLLKNVCLKRLRRIRVRREAALDGHDVAQASGSANAEASVAAVQKALAKLSAEHREVIILRHWEDLPYQSIAAATGVSIGTVMSRLHYARLQLQRVLAEEVL